MFKKLKRLIALSKKDPKALKLLEELTEEELDSIPEEGDGKAVFFGEGSHDEFLEQEKEDKGIKPWYDRLRNL